jgi:Fe-S-cluster containining protein
LFSFQFLCRILFCVNPETSGEQVDKTRFSQGLSLLRQPALPLVSMVQFFFQTGDFATVADVIAEMPEPIETGYARYDHPRQLLQQHLSSLQLLEQYRDTQTPDTKVVDTAGTPLDPMSAVTALVSQQVIEQELEAINSALCAPCGCTLCCVGPVKNMAQEFFEIPLNNAEADLFPLPRFDSSLTRGACAMDDDSLVLEGHAFYFRDTPALFHWKNGWSMILPRQSACPALADSGQCRIYDDRPQVCRKPQIFSYVLEPDKQKSTFCLRGALLAILDCPYVQLLRDEIADYAAACELELVLKGNKQ